MHKDDAGEERGDSGDVHSDVSRNKALWQHTPKRPLLCLMPGKPCDESK